MALVVTRCGCPEIIYIPCGGGITNQCGCYSSVQFVLSYSLSLSLSLSSFSSHKLAWYPGVRLGTRLPTNQLFSKLLSKILKDNLAPSVTKHNVSDYSMVPFNILGYSNGAFSPSQCM